MGKAGSRVRGKNTNPDYIKTSSFKPAKLESLTSNKKLTFHNFDPSDRDGWLKLRIQLTGMEDIVDTPRFGGSEVAVLFGLSEYKSAGALYYERLFLKEDTTKPNMHMYRGQVFEDVIIDKYWKYFNPNKTDALGKEIKDGDILKNSSKRKIVREAISLHSTVLNQNYPHLLANIDSLIVEGTLGVLEIKSLFKTAADKYEAGVSPQYVIQLQVYLLVLGLEYGEIFMLLDSTEPRCIRMEANKEIQQNIIDKVNEFGERIVKAREEIAASDGSEEVVWDIAAKYEPEPEETSAYLQFLKEIYKNPKGEIVASDEIEQFLWTFSKAKIKIKELQEGDVQNSEIHIRKFFIDNDVDTVITNNGTKVNWKSRLSINVKKILGL